MGYFPLFIDLQNKPCLIVGGGTVALRKAEKLLPYGPRITVIAPEFTPELAALDGVSLMSRTVSVSDLEGQTLVIAATDDPERNHAISLRCQELSIPVNVVDDKAFCTFLFPCLVKRGDLSVGISTSGASPSAAIWLKQQVQTLVPEDFDQLLAWLEAQRPRIKDTVPERQRSAVFARLFTACLGLGRGLTEEELVDVLTQEGNS